MSDVCRLNFLGYWNVLCCVGDEREKIRFIYVLFFFEVCTDSLGIGSLVSTSMFVIDLGLFGMICSHFVWLVRKIVLDSSSEFSDSSPGLCLL